MRRRRWRSTLVPEEVWASGCPAYGALSMSFFWTPDQAEGVASSRRSGSMNSPLFDIGICVRPMPGEARGGDFAVAVRRERRAVAVLIDVAGHGMGSFVVGRPVAQHLTEIAKEPRRLTPSLLLSAANELLRDTQGAAVAAAVVENNRACVASLGNVRCLRVHLRSDRSAHCTRISSRDGLVGVRFHSAKEQTFDFGRNELLIMHSDGVGRNIGDWSVSEMYAGRAASIARAIVSRYGRDTDDASCLVIKPRAPEESRSEG